MGVQRILAAVGALFAVAIFSTGPVTAQFLPGGCPGRWVSGGGGMMCLCPNGSYANYVGGSIVCSGGGGGGGARRSNIPSGSTHCGGGRYCKKGLKCASDGKCLEKDAVDCGSGKFCAAGSKCAKSGNGCLPKDAVDCGAFTCSAGNVCAPNKKCVTEAHARRLRGGGPLDSKMAKEVRPAVAVASSVASGSTAAAANLGYKRVADWRSMLAKGGKSQAEINEWEKAGFSAGVFARHDRSSGARRVIIAFKGPEPAGLSAQQVRDWIKSNWPQQVGGGTPPQYERALEFARTVQQQAGPNDKISVTGFLLGGALASFVGNLLKLETTTINAPTQSLAPMPQFGAEAAPNQTNIITAGDPVSDPLADPDANLGAEAKPLPGTTHVIELKDAKAPPHELKSIIKYVEELAGAEKSERSEPDRGSAFDRCVAGWLRRQGGRFAPEGESTSCMDGNIRCVKSKSDVYTMCSQPGQPWAVKPY